MSRLPRGKKTELRSRFAEWDEIPFSKLSVSRGSYTGTPSSARGTLPAGEAVQLIGRTRGPTEIVEGIGSKIGAVLVLAALVLVAVLAGFSSGGSLVGSSSHGLRGASPSPVLEGSTGTSELLHAERALALSAGPGSAVTPSPRSEAALAYDAGDGYAVLFGGRSSSGSALADTWTYVGGNWTELSLSTHPSARDNASMTYDSADGYVLLFGGYSGTKVLGDTWEFTGGKWTQISPTTSPVARAGASMSFDGKDGYVVLFGGGTSAVSPLHDTWTYLAGTWTELSATKSPSARAEASIGYDSTDSYVVLFGGLNQTGKALADTWKFVGGAWTKLSPSHPPSARSSAGLTGDTADGGLVLFGGVGSSGAVLGDTWTFVGGAWTHLTPVNSPPSLGAPDMAFDAKDGHVVLFGGMTHSSGPYAHVWEYLARSWSEVPFTVTSANAQDGGDFGWAVAADSSIVVVGAPDETVGEDGFAGHAYTFSATTGALLTTLTSPNAQSSGVFGRTVAVSGSTVVVGAPLESAGGFSDAGGAYVFNGKTGHLISTLADPNEENGGEFGTSVAISGTTAVVGAIGVEVSSFSNAGEAYSFDSSTGALIADLSNPSPATGSEFGTSVGIEGNVVVVGAPEFVSGSGAAYTFDASNGTLVETYSSPNPVSGGDFGFSVAIDSSLVVIGAPDQTSGGLSQAGNAYAFTLTGGLVQSFSSPNAQVDGRFGGAVGVSGTSALVGALFETAGGQTDAGRAYLFDADTDSLLAEFTSPQPQQNALFGTVGIGGGIIAIGAYQSATPSDVEDAGTAYLY